MPHDATWNVIRDDCRVDGLRWFAVPHWGSTSWRACMKGLPLCWWWVLASSVWSGPRKFSTSSREWSWPSSISCLSPSDLCQPTPPSTAKLGLKHTHSKAEKSNPLKILKALKPSSAWVCSLQYLTERENTATLRTKLTADDVRRNTWTRWASNSSTTPSTMPRIQTSGRALNCRTALTRSTCALVSRHRTISCQKRPWVRRDLAAEAGFWWPRPQKLLFHAVFWQFADFK